jgi:hypothetical protein
MSLSEIELKNCLSSTETQLHAAFLLGSRPDFAVISEIGCCAEHEASFRWYREHIWSEFSAAANEGLLDPCEFGSLKPSVYHYFVPGVCQFILDTLRRCIGESCSILWSDLNPWLGHLVPSGRQSKPHDGIELFSSGEKAAVLAVIEAYLVCHEALEGYLPKEGKFDPFPIARTWWGVAT